MSAHSRMSTPTPPADGHCVPAMHPHMGRCWRAGWAEGYAAATAQLRSNAPERLAAVEPTDEQVAAWSREMNHGVPPWECLSEEARAWWRDRYRIRHGT